jgi:TRAP-type C4-dicarboxylate transport system permease small subunit
VERLALLAGQAIAWVFLAAAGVTAWEVAARYLFDAPTSWAHATTTVLCAIGFAFGGAYAFARGEHIRITAVLDRVPRRGRAVLEVLALLLGAIYLAGLGYAAWGQAAEAAWRFEAGFWAPELTPGPPNWPLPTILRVALAAGTLLFLACVLQRLFAKSRGRA